MTEYRVYLLDGEGKITWGTWMQAESVADAVLEVSKLYDCRCEIWLGLQRLATVPAKVQDSTAPAR